MSLVSTILTIFFILFFGVCWYYLLLNIPSFDKGDDYKKLIDAYIYKCNEVKGLRREIEKLEHEINKLKNK